MRAKALESIKGVVRRSLNLSRVFELGVRRGVHHLVASREIRQVTWIARDWKNSYLVVLAVKDRAK